MKYRSIKTELMVSVVLPVYNREDTVARAINSVLNQSYTNLELIIVDDCSTDQSLRVIRGFQDDRINVIALQQNEGANAARNRGVAEARGRFIAFQDSDDEWAEDKLKMQIDDMVCRNLAASFCAHFLVDGTRRSIVPKDYEKKEKYEADLSNILKNYNVVSTQTLVVSKDIFIETGGFDEDMPRLQDYEFVIRLVQKAKIGYIAKPLVFVYRTTESISTNLDALCGAVALLLAKHRGFLNIESILSFFLSNELSVGDGSRLHVDCMRLQETLSNKNIDDINILEYAVGQMAGQIGLHNRVQGKLYEDQLEKLKSNHFVIYGAGNVAENIYFRLSAEKIYPRGFLVTGRSEEETFHGIPVYSVDQWKDLEIMVIVGVSLPQQSEIVDTLLESNFQSIVCYPYW